MSPRNFGNHAALLWPLTRSKPSNRQQVLKRISILGKRKERRSSYRKSTSLFSLLFLCLCTVWIRDTNRGSVGRLARCCLKMPSAKASVVFKAGIYLNLVVHEMKTYVSDTNVPMIIIYGRQVICYRVLVPLRNMPEFGKAFNCPVGSPMVPEKNCDPF